MIEVWKIIPIQELEGRYEISNYGICRSVGYTDIHNRYHKPQLIKSNLDRRGYPRLYFTVNNKKFMIRVHRAVALAFIPNIKNLPQINHKDGIKTNNFVENLEWCDNLYNRRHGEKLGLYNHPKGEQHPNFIAPIKVYKNGELIDTLYGNLDAKNKGYEIRNVSACLFGKRKSHRGCNFKR